MRQHGPSIAIGAAGSLLAAALLALLGAMSSSFDEVWFWIVCTCVAALITTASVVLCLRLRAALQEHQRSGASSAGAVVVPPPDMRLSGSTPGGRVLLGIDVGRTRVSYGLIRVSAGVDGGLPRSDEFEVIERPPPSWLALDLGGRGFYPALADAIGEMLAQVEAVDGIGIGVPGQVRVTDGCLVESPSKMQRGERFVDRLAAALLDSPERASSLQALGISTDTVEVRLQSKLARRMLLDNDVRCATRFLQTQYPEWRNFACIIVGTGLGVGLVLERVLYYGTNAAAGEAGHMMVHLARRASDEIPFEPPICGCGFSEAVHWESIANGPALAQLAAATDPEAAADLARSFNGGPSECASITGPQLVAAAKWLEQPHDDGSELAKLLADDRNAQYVRKVVRDYSGNFLAGVANLVNVLNLDHVILGGGVMDGVARLAVFGEEWRSILDRRLLHVPRRTLEHFELYEGVNYEPNSAGRAWEGAALLFWDPSYHSVRETAMNP